MRPRTRSESGQILVLIAVSFVALLTVFGLILDGGLLLAERRRAQNAADGAALAAGSDLVAAQPVQAASSAVDYARRNGYNNDGTTNTVTVNIPPTSGTFAGNANYAQVIITRSSRPLVMGLVFSGTQTITVAAVAGSEQNTGDAAILALNRSGLHALKASGNGSTTVTGGNIMCDSNNGSALFLNGTSTMTANRIAVSGNYIETNQAQFTPTPVTGVAPIEDPLRSVPAPSLEGLTVYGAVVDNSPGDLVLSPGVYEGGISVSGRATVTLQPGVYVMKGGGLSVAGNATVTGSGVLIYNTSDSYGRYGQVSVTGNGTVNLSPPTSGPYQGLTFFQDRAATVGAVFAGNALISGLSGTIYFPSASVQISGDGTMNGAQIVSDKLDISGNGNLSILYDRNRIYPALQPYLVQ